MRSRNTVRPAIRKACSTPSIFATCWKVRSLFYAVAWRALRETSNRPLCDKRSAANESGNLGGNPTDYLHGNLFEVSLHQGWATLTRAANRMWFSGASHSRLFFGQTPQAPGSTAKRQH